MLMTIFFLSGCAAYQVEGTGSSDYSGTYNLNDLNSYGEWVYLSPYGEVWRPYVVADWRPFDNGHWVFSDDAWTWISYEPFGWIVYHYGYWYDDPFYGWVWVPSDSQWSPARVEWLNYGDYVGWAPLPPPGVDYGDPWEQGDEGYWNVVRQQNFTRDDVGDYRMDHPLRNEMGGRGIMNEPPQRREIERATGGEVEQMRIPHERVELPPPRIERMKLPPAESQRVQQREPEVKRRELVPREQFRREHPEEHQQRRATEQRESGHKERERK